MTEAWGDREITLGYEPAKGMGGLGQGYAGRGGSSREMGQARAHFIL